VFIKGFRLRRQFIDVDGCAALFLDPGPAAEQEEAADIDEALGDGGVEVNLPGQSIEGNLFHEVRHLRSDFGDDAVGDNAGRGKRRERRAVGGADHDQGHQEGRHADAGRDRHGDRGHQGATGDIARSDGGDESRQHEDDQGNNRGVAFTDTHRVRGEFFHGAVGLSHTEQERNTDQDHEQADREKLHDCSAGGLAEQAGDDDGETDGQESDVQVFIHAADGHDDAKSHDGRNCRCGKFHKNFLLFLFRSIRNASVYVATAFRFGGGSNQS